MSHLPADGPSRALAALQLLQPVMMTFDMGASVPVPGLHGQ